MEGERRKRDYGGLTVGFFILIIAAAILIGWYMEDWSLFIPIVLIGCGVYGIALGGSLGRRSRPRDAAKSSASYHIFWGAFLAIVGSIWIANDLYPGNVPLLAAAFLIWLAVTIIVLTLRR